ncbi:MAG: nucleotide exchange factor GrpE [Candidatus Omnitrophica bacterium]|nr:nucleotide exchange factor GrpE [Candidatus Omnitrophota bacterium]MCM8828073.1 nucleotide exchange factor GrpE [Candidatus Omnitrophota bacterium]
MTDNKEKIIHIKEKDFRKVATFRTRAKQLEKRVASLEKELSDWKERTKKVAADLDNMRKRVEKEKIDFAAFLQATFAEKLLFFDEIFEKIVNDVCSDPGISKNIADGLLMLKKQSSSLLESLGVKKLETVGRKFDPMIHEAVEIVETDDKPEGTVVEEVRSGYIMNGKLLKPAQVKVSSGKTNSTGAGKN